MSAPIPEGDKADKADERLHLTKCIPDGEYNRDVEIDAIDDGIEIDEYIFISWEWLAKARRIRSARKRARRFREHRRELSGRVPSVSDVGGLAP